MSPAPRVVLADEHPTTMASARRLLERDGFTVCGEAADADGGGRGRVPRAPRVVLRFLAQPFG